MDIRIQVYFILAIAGSALSSGFIVPGPGAVPVGWVRATPQALPPHAYAINVFRRFPVPVAAPRILPQPLGVYPLPPPPFFGSALPLPTGLPLPPPIAPPLLRPTFALPAPLPPPVLPRPALPFPSPYPLQPQLFTQPQLIAPPLAAAPFPVVRRK